MGNLVSGISNLLFSTNKVESDVTIEEYYDFLDKEKSDSEFQHLTIPDFNIYIRRKLYMHQRRYRLVQQLDRDIEMYERHICLLQNKVKSNQEKLSSELQRQDVLQTDV